MIPGILAAGAVRADGPTPGGDPHWSNVISLLNMQGADGSTAFVDAKGKTWTPNGDAQIDDSLGYNTGLFPSSPARLATPSHADWAMGTGDFTIEAWVRPSALTGDRNILSVGLVNAVTFGATSSGRLFCGPNSVSYGAVGTTVLSTSVMQHVEASRYAGRTRIFLNGVMDASALDANNYVQGPAFVAAGSSDGGATFGSGYFTGNIRALRVTKGAARHSSDASFTPPPAPFPNGP